MFQITLFVGPQGAALGLLFNDEELARSAAAQFSALLSALPNNVGIQVATACLTIADQYGQEISVAAGDLHGVILENLTESAQAHIERGLHQARTQAKAESMAASDPILRSAQYGRANGPAVLQPMTGMPRRGFNG